jgi:hypothetical protein
MNKQSALAAAALVASFVGALAAGPPARAQNAYEKMTAHAAYCAGGYHVDPEGNCQPDNPIVDGRCPPYFHAIVFPNGNGYRCMPGEY